MADEPRIFSGIRASGDKTLGNYSGGYRQYAATQEQGEAFFCIVDLHSITTARRSSPKATSARTRRPHGC
jgi:tryptophanyl-tRNA synthetase